VGHFASYEMADRQIVERSVSERAFAAGEAPFAYSDLNIPERADRIDRTMLREIVEDFREIKVSLHDKGAQTLLQLEASCRATQRRFGRLDFLVVDYLQLMRSDGRGDKRYELITEISQGLKRLALRLRVPVIALSQLSRANEARDDKRPQLSDLRESGSLEQDADVVLGIYREAYYLAREEPKPEQFKSDKDRTADENFSLAYYEWEGKMRAAERTLEVICLKQRAGPVGADVLDFWDRYDAARDRPDPFQSRAQDQRS
jgi:replicative DNA helicase